MKELVFFLEERSAQEMLHGVLPRLLDENTGFRCIPFEGKQDLEKQLAKRLRNWRNPDACFVVLRDQDSGDCAAVKQRLIEICRATGKPDTLVRIVCHELESWFLGDLQAVEAGLGMPGLARQQQKRKFRDPDRLQNPKQELRRLTKNQYQQILGSREIGRHLSLAGNRSTSFNVFIAGVNRLLNQENFG
jgi:hypothetical protein